MSAEGKPLTEPALLSRPLAWITRQVLRLPMAVLAAAAVLTVVALFLTATRLGFRTSRLDLLNPQSGYNQLWIEYINEFGDADDVVVVVEGESRQQVLPVVEELSETIAREDHLFRAVLHEVDLSRIRAKGLHYLQPDDLLAIEGFLDRVEPILTGDWARLTVGNMSRAMCGRLAAGASPDIGPRPGEEVRSGSTDSAAAEAQLGRLSKSLVDAFAPVGLYQSPWPEMPNSVATFSDLGSEYMLADQGRMGFVLLQFAQRDNESFAQGTKSIDTLRNLIATARKKHPQAKIGLTGLPVMENDEMRSSQSAMLKASLLSLFGVACLFVAGFGGLKHPLMTVATLLIAMAWSFGYVTIAIGHLNILSISFGVILIGLGIDFGVHYVTRYMQLRGSLIPSDEALIQTAGGVGPGILTGAITTAIAFFMAGFTEFTGIAELGIIAGGGILLCCAATMIVLPAMIHLSDANRTGQAIPMPLDIHGWVRPLFRKPLLLLAITAAGTVGLSLGMSRLEYDHNLLNLQPEGLESVELERRLLEQSDQSVWFALAMAHDREELLAKKERFTRLASVERVDEIASRIPAHDDSRRPIIERIHRRLANLPERPPQLPVDQPEQVGQLLARMQLLVGDTPHALKTRHQLEQVRDWMRRMPEAECLRRLSDYQHHVAGDLLSRLYLLRDMSNPEPPQLTDLPESLVTRFVGADGRHLLKIYSKGDIWDMQAMEQFVTEVREVDPLVTGNPLQTYEASRQMKSSYEQAAWYALATILVVLYLDLGSLRHTLLAMLPLGLGMLQLFGILGLLDIPLNPANMIVLPLILGIGIDDGVHVIHDFRRQRGRYQMSPSTASAVLITSLTTMVGFGSLMIASHRGLQSLGRVLTIGVSCCLFTSLVMLPAVLAWTTRNRQETPEDTGDSHNELLQPERIVRHHPAHGLGEQIHAPAATGLREPTSVRDR
jgi:uncharacterized protein